MSTTNALLVILLFVMHTNGLLKVLSPPELVDKNYADALLNINPKVFNLTGFVSLPSPRTGCERFVNEEEVKGKIVLVTGGGYCTHTDRARNCARAGCVAMISLCTGLCRGHLGIRYGMDNPTKDTLVPSIDFLNGEVFYDYLEKNIAIEVWIQDTDDNPWFELGDSPLGIAFRTWMIVLCVTRVLVSGHRWFKYYQFQGLELNIPQTCLSLACFWGIVDISLYSLAVLYFRPLLTPSWYAPFAQAVGFSILFVTYLLLAFFWQQLLSDAKRSIWGRNTITMRILFGTAVTLLTAQNFIAATIQSWVIYLPVQDIWTATGVAALITRGGVGFFFAYNGIRVLIATRQLQDEEKRGRLKRLRWMVVLCCVCISIGQTFGIIYQTKLMQISPTVTLIIYTVYFTSQQIASFVVILSFAIPKEPKLISVPTTASLETSANYLDLHLYSSEMEDYNKEDK